MGNGKLNSVRKPTGKKETTAERGEFLDGATEFIKIGTKKLKLANREELLNEMQSIGLAEKELQNAEIVQKDGKEVVQATDKHGKPRFFEILESVGDKIKNNKTVGRVAKVVQVAGIVVGLNLFASCMTTGSMAYKTTAVSQNEFGNGTRTEQSVRPDYEAGYNNVWEAGVADMVAADPSFIRKLENGGMSYLDATRWAMTGGSHRNRIFEKLMGDGLKGDAYTVIQNDILYDMRSVTNRAVNGMREIDTNLMSSEELNPMIAQRQTDSRDLQRNAVLITFKEWFSAVNMSPQPKQPGQDRVGYNHAENEFVTAKDAHMARTGTPDNAANRLTFYTSEMVRILRKNFEDLAKQNPQQFTPILQSFNNDLVKLNVFAADPTNMLKRVAAVPAFSNLTSMLANGFDIDESHMSRFWEEYTLITTMLGNIRTLERNNPKLKDVSKILDAHEPVQQSSHSSSESNDTKTPDGGGTTEPSTPAPAGGMDAGKDSGRG